MNNMRWTEHLWIISVVYDYLLSPLTQPKLRIPLCTDSKNINCISIIWYLKSIFTLEAYMAPLTFSLFCTCKMGRKKTYFTGFIQEIKSWFAFFGICIDFVFTMHYGSWGYLIMNPTSRPSRPIESNWQLKGFFFFFTEFCFCYCLAISALFYWKTCLRLTLYAKYSLLVGAWMCIRKTLFHISCKLWLFYLHLQIQ